MTGIPRVPAGITAYPYASVDDVRALVQELVRCLHATDLRPGPVVDALFRQLVRTVSTVGPGLPEDETCCTPTYLSTRAICAQGESLLEEHWARRVVDDPGALAAFPYRENYRALAHGEYGALRRALGRRPRAMAFVGSGPLPLSAIDWHLLDRGLRITCVDHDEVALRQGARVVDTVCPHGARPQFVHAPAEDVDCANVDAVIVAAMVGHDRATKRALLGTIVRTMPADAVLAARSVPPDGRQWLYPRVDAAHPPEGTRVIGEWLPPPGVINSLLLLRRDRPGG